MVVLVTDDDGQIEYYWVVNAGFLYGLKTQLLTSSLLTATLYRLWNYCYMALISVPYLSIVVFY